jgi:hypothetical protein
VIGAMRFGIYLPNARTNRRRQASRLEITTSAANRATAA